MPPTHRLLALPGVSRRSRRLLGPLVRQRQAGASIPDLAVLDLNLPKIGGLEILEAMRASRAFAGIPVAILSSTSSPRERAKIDAFGVDRFITKPLDLEEFLRIGVTLKTLLTEARRGGQSPVT